MIYDKMENLYKYPELSKIQKFLEENEGKLLANGRYVIAEDCYVNVSEYETGVGNDFEVHQEYIDLQYVPVGREYIYVQDKRHGKLLKEYDSKQDVAFYEAKDFNKFIMDNDCFLVLDIDDLHKPGVFIGKSTKVKKYVFKIKRNA